MSSNIIIFAFVLLALLILEVPVAFSLGITSIVALVSKHGINIPSDLIAQRMFYGLNNFTILAVPFFIFAGRIMNTGGITKKIFDFADVTIGHIKGGLAQTNILASMLFAGMSGAAVSDAAGLGTIELDAMDKKGYDRAFSVAVTGASSTVGPIIPPSIPMVFYAMQAGVSVGALFIGALIPGILMGVSMMFLVYYYAIRGKCPPPRKKATFKEIVNSFVNSFLPLLTPVIIIGGIYSGWFTPTEAAVVASLYAIVISLIFKELKLSDFPEIILATIKDTVVMAFIVACSYIYAYLIVSSGIPIFFSKWLIGISSNKIVILLIINIFLLIVGCFLEGVCAILILTPILLPVVISLGISPIHFGVVMVLNLMIGLITPPFGLILFVMARISKLKLNVVIKATLPFMIPLVVVLLLITFIPELVMYLPTVLGLVK